MKEYGLTIIGTGSAMNYIDAALQKKPGIRIAVIDKDAPGGICITRGCIPSKLLLYPADLVRTIETAKNFGIDAGINGISFEKIMRRMRAHTSQSIGKIQQGLSNHPRIDYYREIAEFVAPYKLDVGGKIIASKVMFLCTGSKAIISDIAGLGEAGYLTSDTLLKLEKLPESLIIIGGGYVAAEYAHFFSAMGSKVTIIGRNPRLLPGEEPEISALAKKEMSKYMQIMTGSEVIEVQTEGSKKKKAIAITGTGKKTEYIADEILVAAGRGPNTDILKPEKGGIKTDKNGWIVVNEYLETSKRNVWSFGDAIGKYPFKHAANYESRIAYQNAFFNMKTPMEYYAIPHAIFSHPQIASVGLKEDEAVAKYGEDNLFIGFEQYGQAAKGMIMHASEYFVKVILERRTNKILGAHIIGPDAPVLIQEIINLMYTQTKDAKPIFYGMHIHPSLSEVVENAFKSLSTVMHYHHILENLHLEEE